MNSLGIFFGSRMIAIAETKGKRIVNNVQVNRQSVSTGDLEEKVPEELKLVALFKDELRRNKIEVNETGLVLSGKDLIIRTFEMPLLPPSELNSAITFEAKKYIPFKLEDIVSDFQVKSDRANRRNLVLFMGIKKDVFNRYISILNQLSLKTAAIEYSAFSVLRVAKLAGLVSKGVVGLVSVGFQEDDEINFTVLEDDFPLFSRDIALSGMRQDTPQPEDAGMAIEKLKTELRISLDFYHRKLPNKNITRLYFVCADEHRGELEGFAREMGLPSQFVEISKLTGKSMPFSLAFIRSFGCSLYKEIRSPLKVNLLAPKTARQPGKEMALTESLGALFTDIRIDKRIITLGALTCAATLAVGVYRTFPVKKELALVVSMRPKVATVNSDLSFSELNTVDGQYRDKVVKLDAMIKKQLYLTSPLDVIPRVIPQGVWLNDFDYHLLEGVPQLTLRGVAYLADSDKELKTVNAFMYYLKENQNFSKMFPEINIESMSQTQSGKMQMTGFVITCKGSRGK